MLVGGIQGGDIICNKTIPWICGDLLLGVAALRGGGA